MTLLGDLGFPSPQGSKPGSPSSAEQPTGAGPAPLATHLKSNDPPALSLDSRAGGSSTRGE